MQARPVTTRDRRPGALQIPTAHQHDIAVPDIEQAICRQASADRERDAQTTQVEVDRPIGRRLDLEHDPVGRSGGRRSQIEAGPIRGSEWFLCLRLERSATEPDRHQLFGTLEAAEGFDLVAPLEIRQPDDAASPRQEHPARPVAGRSTTPVDPYLSARWRRLSIAEHGECEQGHEQNGRAAIDHGEGRISAAPLRWGRNARWRNPGHGRTSDLRYRT